MLQDRRGRLWVGTWVNGVFYWEAGQGWRQPRTDQPTPWHPVDALAEDEDGRIWMVTRDGSLYRIAERKVTVLSPPEEAGRITINSACVTRDGSYLGGHRRRRRIPIPRRKVRAIDQWARLYSR